MLANLIEWIVYKLLYCPLEKRNCELGYHNFSEWSKPVSTFRGFTDRKQTRCCKKCQYIQERHF